MNRRGPKRIARRPARPESANMTTVIGTVASPLRRGE
jgi:hypothetical protein